MALKSMVAPAEISKRSFKLASSDRAPLADSIVWMQNHSIELGHCREPPSALTHFSLRLSNADTKRVNISDEAISFSLTYSTGMFP